MKTLLFIACGWIVWWTYTLWAIGSCDGNKSCVGRAYTASVSTGQNHHYVNVAASPSLRNIRSAMTLEMWINATRQAGSKVMIAGIWGPYTDDNDVWIAYISPSDDLTFEVNGPQNLGAADNTIARTPFASHYGQWTHIAVTFESGIVRLYVNGALRDSAYNAQYPAFQLRQPQNPNSALKIGSINGFFDSPQNRAFVGQLDEIRLWSRVLSQQELACNRFRSLEGNETGLVLYFRCNEQENDFLTPLCDASGNGNNGRMFSGATCRALSSPRTVPRTVTITPPAIATALECDSTFTWTVTISDTSQCGSTVNLTVGGRDRSFFRVTPAQLALPPGGIPMTATITYSGYLTGSIQAFVRIASSNRCGSVDTVNITLYRRTELSYQLTRVTFDTLFARCPSRSYSDTLIRICNITASLGQPRPITITGTRNRLTSVFQAFPGGGRALPLVLQPGECVDLVVRFFAQDTTALFQDTLIVLSTDRCPGGGIIPLAGRTQQVFAIRQTNGQTPITAFQFPATCPGDLSDPRAWNWYNLTARNLIIDSVVFPRQIVAIRLPRMPYTLRPSSQAGEQDKYFRFRPLQPGNVRDSIVFYARLPGEPCQFVIAIPITGRGLDNNISFVDPSIDFGAVIVGQEARRDVVLRNGSTTDALTVSLYLKRGQEFVLLQRNVQVAPQQTRVLANVLAFRPTDAVDYSDTLCLFEQRCFATRCIPVHGKGYFERFRYQPPVVHIERVLSCDSSTILLTIVNLSSIDQQLSNVRLDDPSGFLVVVDPITGLRTTLPSTLRIGAGDSITIAIRFVPTAGQQDVAIVGFLRYRSSSGEEWMAQIHANSIAPKLYVTPITDYGTLEVGEVRDDTVAIENISPLPVRVDRINLPAGYAVQSVQPPLPATLAPRDSLIAIVRFAPLAPQSYNASVVAESDSPCVRVQASGQLRGQAIVYRLDAPISIQNFSYVRPCECVRREIPLVNNSFVHPMSVDTLFLDTTGIPGATPQLFMFSSTYYEQNGRQFPFTIPPRSSDTLWIVFCPRTAADTSQLVASARLIISAHGAGWNAQYSVFLLGRRALTFRPRPTQITFPLTLVDVDAAVNPSAPPVSQLTIPSLALNPFQDTVQIDSIGFLPDDRVFSYTLTNERNQSVALPYQLIPNGQSALRLRFGFRPRAPRTYRARVAIYYSKPCVDIDTTILLVGAGSAGFPYSLYLQFDSTGVAVDTFRVISCDTLHLPVYPSRALPKTSPQQSSIHLTCRFAYDTTKLRLLGVTTPYGSVSSLQTDSQGAIVELRRLLNVDSLGQMMIAHFVPLRQQTDTVSIELRDMLFDTDEILRYDLSATRGDRALVYIDRAAITLSSPSSGGVLQFDSVRVLDCAQRQIIVRNTGDVPVRIDTVVQIPSTVRVISFVPPQSVLRMPGNETTITLEYCPRDLTTMDTLITIVSSLPCWTTDSVRLQGTGYAPIFPLRITTDSLSPQTPQPRGGIIGDTIDIPFALDRDVAATYRGTTYWLQAFSFAFSVRWNHTQLKYLGVVQRSAALTLRDTFDFPNQLRIRVETASNVTAGAFATARFVVTVPDTTLDHLVIEPLSGVRSDSLLFLDVQLLGSTTPTITGGKCGVTFARIGQSSGVFAIEPNPTDGTAVLTIGVEEFVRPTITLYNSTGQPVHTWTESLQYAPGVHRIPLNLGDTPSGVYRIVVHAGVVVQTGTLVIVR